MTFSSVNGNVDHLGYANKIKRDVSILYEVKLLPVVIGSKKDLMWSDNYMLSRSFE